MRESIDKRVKDGNWEFAKLLKLNEVCDDLAQEYYSKLSPAEILKLIWETQIDEGGRTLGQIISMECRNVLKDEFIASFQKHFETATVSFKSPIEELKADNPINMEQPPLPKPKKEKPKDTVKNPDGTDLPKGVKRL